MKKRLFPILDWLLARTDAGLEYFKTHYRVLVPFLVLPFAILAILHHEEPILFLLGDIAFALVGVVVNTFVIIYSRRNWRANPYGRALMYSKMSLATIFNLSLLVIFFGDYEYRSVLRLAAGIGILVAQARLLYLLFSTRMKTEESVQRMKDIEGA